MKVLRPQFAALGLIVCLHAMTSACGARSVPPTDPAPAAADPLPPVASPPITPTPAPAPSPATPPPAAEVDECSLIAAPGEPIATIALGDRVDAAHAPRPTNGSERLLFRQLYETLVRADCAGRAGAGLAARWRVDDNGTTWLVTLRENAQFADGTPVAASDVRTSWTLPNGELRREVSRLVQSIVVIDDQTMAITLGRQGLDAPLALAHPDLAISKSVQGSLWPLGTRSNRVAPESTASAVTVTRGTLPSLRFLVTPTDARDGLDQDVDLLLTRDRGTLDYAATLPHFQSLPLPWRRTRLLVMPGRAPGSPSLSDQAREVLAVDAVRGEARGAQGPFWWETAADCRVALPPARTGPPFEPRVVYDAGDDAARDLAERFVGLMRASGPAAAAFVEALLPDRPRRAYRRASGLTGDTLERAVRLGRDAGYVVAVDSRPLDPCAEIEALVDRAPWLDPATVVPLIDTRLHALVKRGRSGLTTEWDGVVLITPPAVRDPQ